VTNESQLLARHACSALVITCSDFRFKSAEREFLTSAGLLDDYDLLALPGAIRPLVAPRNTSARDILVEEIRLLWSLHKFTRVLAINHLGCRAYADLATAENEREVHTDHLRRARDVIEQPFVDVRAETYLAQPDAQGIAITRVT
jgi:hypothetical protein